MACGLCKVFESLFFYFQLVQGLRVAFKSGKTKTFEWRKQQLEGVLKLLDENREEIAQALNKDLHKVNSIQFMQKIDVSFCEFENNQLCIM